MKLYRHGDILLKKVSVAPKAAREVVRGQRYVVAEGEVTGHFHELTCPEATGIRVLEHEMRRYLELSDTCQLRHQEHHELRIEPGVYEIVTEREWDYADEEMKKVVD